MVSATEGSATVLQVQKLDAIVSNVFALGAKIEVLDERMRNREKALELQAKEYERRLEDLNHAHAQAQAKNAEYLPRDVYAKSEEELRLWRRKVDDVIVGLQTSANTKTGLFTGAASIIALGLSIVLALNTLGAF